MLTPKKLFEISVYRIEESTYHREMSAHIEKENSKYQIPLNEGYLRKEYGGDWRYNEIIGFLQFYRYGDNQIRCNYWETDSIRKVRTRQKRFVQISDSYCHELFSKSASNLNLAQTIKSAVEHCETRLKKKNRVLNKELFDNTVDFIDWKSLLS